MSDKSLYQNCLAQVQSFETLWAYYSQSDGQLYDDECRMSARSFLDTMYSIAQFDGRLKDQLDSTTVNKVKVELIVENLDSWADSDSVAPFDTFAKSRTMLFGFLSGLKLFLHVELQIPITPVIMMRSDEIEHSERALRWKGYLPNELLMSSKHDPDELVRSACKGKTIVAIGDIRRSQQLMEYAKDDDVFLKFMSSFIHHSRALIEKHKGFFDKFTGDGFIAYFNEEICSRLNVDYVDCFLGFVDEELKFMDGLFSEWRESVSRLPPEPVGLAIGGGAGIVDFRDVDNHLIVVGDAVVWAYRTVSDGEAGEFIAHEPLSELISNRPGLSFSPREGVTKNGMPYKSSAVTFD